LYAFATRKLNIVASDLLIKRTVRNGIPASLNDWLVPVKGKGVARDIPSFGVVLGSDGAYFAQDKDGYHWADLPTRLDNAIKERMGGNKFKPGKAPRYIALGPNGSYLLIDTSGGATWSSNLKTEVPDLDAFVRAQFAGAAGGLDGLVSLLQAVSPNVSRRCRLTMRIRLVSSAPAEQTAT